MNHKKKRKIKKMTNHYILKPQKSNKNEQNFIHDLDINLKGKLLLQHIVVFVLIDLGKMIKEVGFEKLRI